LWSPTKSYKVVNKNKGINKKGEDWVNLYFINQTTANDVSANIHAVGGHTV
jgi:hypothetical protein